MTKENYNFIRWPRPGHILSLSDVSSDCEAPLDEWGDYFLNSFLAYAFGYRESANALVDTVEARDISASRAVYSVCFLYRHYIELMLKGLIRLGNHPVDDYPKHHDIGRLWQICRPLLERSCPKDDQADIPAIENCIEKFVTLDPSGEAFRYGADRHGNAHFEVPPLINLTALRDLMDRVSWSLDLSYDYMLESLQNKVYRDSKS
ncbi:MAG: hypothetical protein NVS9B4_06700 [Candidatus Acidiferrum sp.]